MGTIVQFHPKKQLSVHPTFRATRSRDDRKFYRNDKGKADGGIDPRDCMHFTSVKSAFSTSAPVKLVLVSTAFWNMAPCENEPPFVSKRFRTREGGG